MAKSSKKSSAAARAPAAGKSPKATSKVTSKKTPASSKKPPPAASAKRAVVVASSAASAAGVKPPRNQAGLSQRELQHFLDLLLAKRRELVGDMSSMEREALRSAGGSNLSNLPIHMADMGTDNYEQEFTLGLMEKDRSLLREINSALGKMQNGTYGVCEGTGKPIAKPRMEAQPWAKYSIEYARKVEKRTSF